MMNCLYERRDLANRFKAHCRSDSKHKRLEACVGIAPSSAGRFGRTSGSIAYRLAFVQYMYSIM